METKDAKTVVEKTTQELLRHLKIDGSVEVSVESENQSLIVSIHAPEESGLLIGRQGKTLQSIQHILNLIVRQQTGEWSRIIVDVADWREKEESRLTDLAMQTADRVRQSGLPQELYNLNSAQRRIVHLALSQMEDIETSSEGEGDNRYLVVQPKQ